MQPPAPKKVAIWRPSKPAGALAALRNRHVVADAHDPRVEAGVLPRAKERVVRPPEGQLRVGEVPREEVHQPLVLLLESRLGRVRALEWRTNLKSKFKKADDGAPAPSRRLRLKGRYISLTH